MAANRHLSLVFLLSPAHCGGRRAGTLLRPGASSPLALRLRDGTLTLGEAFAFMSGLYFRGKLAYARRFAPADDSRSAAYVITPTRGLLSPDVTVSLDMLREFGTTDIASGDWRFRDPLVADLGRLLACLEDAGRVVLLGSIASTKYLDVLAPAIGDRLYYPPSFIGRGDMSRGGLLLRSAAAGVPLDYAPLDPQASRRGPRPPKLGPRDAHGAST